MSASDTPIHPREGLPARVLFSEWGNAPARDAGRTRRPIAKRSDPKHRGYPSLDRVPLIRNLNNESSIVDAAWAENIDQLVILETPPIGSLPETPHWLHLSTSNGMKVIKKATQSALQGNLQIQVTTHFITTPSTPQGLTSGVMLLRGAVPRLRKTNTVPLPYTGAGRSLTETTLQYTRLSPYPPTGGIAGV